MRTIKLLALAAALAGGRGVRRNGPTFAAATPEVAVGPQYGSTHVYVAPADFDRFVASFVATFGGTTSKTGVFTVTPTPSLAMSQLVLTPVGNLSVFGFETPIPYPFGAERTGYLVTDLDAAVQAARARWSGRHRLPVPGPARPRCDHSMAGRSEHAALLAHDVAKLCPARHRSGEPDLCVEGPRRRLHPRLPGLLAWRRDQRRLCGSPGVEIGRPSEVYRRVRIASPVGKLAVLVTDGHLPWPYGREVAGYEVSSVAGNSG